MVTNALADYARKMYGPERDTGRSGSRCHPLIDAVHNAFSDHRPLALSLDDIWLVIAQGFSHHLAENAEKLRPRLVRHSGKRGLIANASELSEAGFAEAIGSFSAEIREATDPVLHENLLCDFVTTTPAVRTASEVVLMDSFSSYFMYLVSFVCGIPRITLEGSPEDWERIRARVEVLETYGLDWWVSRLRPILDEFVQAARSNASPEFWRAIYKPAKGYAATLVTGWICDLFPYIGDPPERRRNPVLARQRHDWLLPALQSITTKSFPSGLCSVPVRGRIGVQSLDLDFVAGFFAVKQSPADLTLSTVIGWSVTERRQRLHCV